MDYFKESLKLHEQTRWKLETWLKMSLNTRDDLSLAYSPWVAEPCREIAKDKKNAYKYTLKANTVAVISDWSAVLGLGNIGWIAWLPVMEWKCALLKEFGWVNAFPIILDTQDTEEIIKTIKNIAPTFGWINLEDFSAPRCFEIEERLKKELDIPVFHDDQHWTAIVTLAWVINGLKITNKDKKDVKVVVNWVWAAWVAITKLLLLYWIENIIMVDSRGTIYKGRDWLNPTKEMLTDITNTSCILDPESKQCVRGWLDDAIKDSDIFVWVSVAWALTEDMVKSMAKDPMIFAMANPTPEIMPDLAYKAWAKIVATGRSDFPNQLNNVLVFPWLFKWALEKWVVQITEQMKLDAAEALASYVKNPTPEEIIPSALDRNVAEAISDVIK